MNYRKHTRTLGIALSVVGLTMAIHFGMKAETNPDPRVWFAAKNYSQFLPIAVSVMLIIAGAFLGLEHKKANFNLAVFGHTASEEALFSWVGFSSSSLDAWVLIFFFAISLLCLWIAYSNVLKQERLSRKEALFGICFGAIIVFIPQLL
ncbi:hypothetical protein VDG1235_15 [Verrucomicrobiia bacterium DG1235]|nr:hypothetical protein VDG1235_15 [Verrucomicrobiae bacterium DG1235]